MAGAGGIRAGRAFVEVTASTSALDANLRKAQARVRAFGDGVRAAGQDLLRLAAGPALAFAGSIRVFSQFDDRMRLVRAVTQATEDEFAALTEEAKRLGRTTSFTATQVANAMAELGRAGFRPEAILTSTEAVLALSRATDTDLPRAAEIAGAALRGFGLEAADMARVADVLTATANGSAQTLEDLFESLKVVAPIAAAAGESIEQTSAALAVLANNGLKGSVAGSALARAFKNLSSSKVRDTLAGIGVSAVDSAGNLRPIATIIAEIGAATADLGTGGRLAVFEELFGRGQAAALKLAESSAVFDDFVQTIQNSTGVATATAEEMDSGVGGSFRRMLSAVEGVLIAIGEATESTFAGIADIITNVAGSVTAFIERNGALVVGVLKATAAVAAMGASLLALGVAGKAAAIALAGARVALVAFTLATKALRLGIIALNLVMKSNPIFFAASLLVAGIVSVASAVGLLSGETDDLAAAAEEAAAALEAMEEPEPAPDRPTPSAMDDRAEALTRAELDALRRVRQLRLKLIEDETAREIALINERFDHEIERAKEAGENARVLAALEEQRQLELLLLSRRRAEEEERAQRRMQEAIERADRDRAQGIEELELRAGGLEGVELERELLALRRRRAIEEARAAGERLDLVEREFDLRAKILDMQERAAMSLPDVEVRGTFNALTAQGLASGSDAANRTAQATEQTARNTRRLVESARSGGLTFA